MKETFYFSHDYNTRTDPKIKKLIQKHGLLGYGIFWALVEDLYQNANALPTDYESIAYDLRTECELVKSVINNFDLFVISDESFKSLSIERRLIERSEKSEKAKKSAEARWNRDKNANALKKDANASKNDAIKESKENESKENKINTSKDVKKESEVGIFQTENFEENLDSENKVPAFVESNRSKITPPWGGRLEKETLKSDFMQNDYCRMQSSRDGVTKDDYEKTVDDFIFEKFGLQENEDWKDLKDARSHFVRWIPFYLKKQKTNEGFSSITVHKGGYGEQGIDNRNSKAAW